MKKLRNGSTFGMKWEDAPAVPVQPPMFERVVKDLGLQRAEYTKSKELRQWVERNYHSHYVPEDLLAAFGCFLTSD